MKRYLKVYLVSLSNSVKSSLAYRANFALTTTMVLIADLIVPLITLLIYNTGSAFPDWNLYEVLVIQGIFVISKGLAGLLFFNIVGNTLSAVQAGEYDLLLIKPVPTMLLSMAGNMDLNSLGSILGGIMILTVAIFHLPAPGLLDVVSFLLLMILSQLSLFAFALFMAGSVFKWVGNSRIFEMFESVSNFGYYPISIYSKTFQTVVSYLIPVALIAYYPASALLGKPLGSVPLLFLSLIFLAAGIMFWNFMLKHYTSAGG